MELMQVSRRIEPPQTKSSSSSFITANTTGIGYSELKRSCIIPVFAKDNESTISHPEFIDLVMEVVGSYFRNEAIGSPIIAVSHPVKGRIPEAIGKPVEELLEHEKTIYWERIAFMVEIPSITETINGNSLSLSVAGVRAYNLENLRGKKSPERFKLCIGFQNKVCINLCVWTDGFQSDIRVMNLHDLFEKGSELIQKFDFQKQLTVMREFSGYSISESQFAHMVGKARMYQFLPLSFQKSIPSLPLSDSQISAIVREYYNSESFSRNSDGEIDLWRLYNLFTGANKSSYIDTFLDRGVRCTDFAIMLKSVLETKTSNWYLN